MRKAEPISRMARGAAAAVSLTAWFFLSNHCALGVVDPADITKSEMTGCPMHSAPAKEKSAPKMPCCKDVRAIVAKCTMPTSVATRSTGLKDYASQILVAPLSQSTEVESLDTGPPGYFSFAELVLQASMLAHAPPVS